ncbi:MAG: DUF4178 domain-containing protein [Armatimonadota bacterium]
MRVRPLKCPSCGGIATIPHGETEAQCIHCGQAVRASQAVLQEQARARAFPPRTPLRPGMKARFRGQEYEATGRVVLRQKDDEGWSQWEEWYLVSADGDLLYLEYDEGKWKVSEPFIPREQVDPRELMVRATGGVMRLDGALHSIQDSGECEIAHVEGEFPWALVPGRRMRYLDLGAGGKFYSIEWTQDELEFYRGEYLDERAVMMMFGLHHVVAEMDRRARVLGSRRGFGGVLIAAALVALFFWMVSMGSGRRISGASGGAQIAQLGPEGQRFGPFPLRAEGRVHRLEIHGALHEQSAWIGAVLEDEQERELITVDRDMWDESGYDSDGYWHESDVHASTDFVVKQPGSYYLRLYGEAETAASNTAHARFIIKEKVLYPIYLAVFGFGMLVLGVGFLLAGSPSGVQRAWEGLKAASDD